MAEAIKGGVRLRSQTASARSGTHLVREFVMDANRPLIYVKQWFEKIDGKPVEMTLWTVNQVRKPIFALMPLGGKFGESRFKALDQLLPKFFQTHATALSLRNETNTNQKVGVSPDDTGANGWVAAVHEKTLMVISHALTKQAKYPDGGCQAKLYAAPHKLGNYIELELQSPLTTVDKGQKLADDQIWQIAPLAGTQRCGHPGQQYRERLSGRHLPGGHGESGDAAEWRCRQPL